MNIRDSKVKIEDGAICISGWIPPDELGRLRSWSDSQGGALDHTELNWMPESRVAVSLIL